MALHKGILAGGTLIMALVAALFGRHVVPLEQETAPQYLARLWELGSAAASDCWVQALLLVPGAAQASVGHAADKVGTFGGHHGPEASEMPNKQDALKQTVAKGRSEIRAQQEVHVQRQREALRESQDVVVLPDHPDEVRARMEPVHPEGPEMRCGQTIEPMSSLTTRDIELRVRAAYIGNQGGAHAWKYVVTFVNHGQETVQMLTRHWVFVDMLGNLESEVKGPGARGVTPVLPPGAEWNYESGTSLPTPHGSMHGSFQMEVLKGDTSAERRSFSARVGRLLLTSETERTPRRVPCALEAASEMLPLTSVFSTERVILGGRADFVEQRVSGSRSYVFQYDVQFNNARDTLVEVVEHSWVVVDASGKKRVVSEGPGVGGIMGTSRYKLPAGGAFRVQGHLMSPTPEANAQGTFKVIIRGDDGIYREIDARTDYMGLSAKKATKQVPNFVADPRFR